MGVLFHSCHCPLISRDKKRVTENYVLNAQNSSFPKAHLMCPFFFKILSFATLWHEFSHLLWALPSLRLPSIFFYMVGGHANRASLFS
jgi:hypothetical protein